MFKLKLWNCLWLLLPVLAWNAVFAGRLPQEGFRSDAGVPLAILAAEHVLRAAVFIWPLFFPLRLGHAPGRAGVILFAAGLLLYFVSWVPLLFAPEATWSKSAAGLLAPACTPLIWLFGIALIGGSPPYAVVSLLFVIIHTWHNVLSHKL